MNCSRVQTNSGTTPRGKKHTSFPATRLITTEVRRRLSDLSLPFSVGDGRTTILMFLKLFIRRATIARYYSMLELVQTSISRSKFSRIAWSVHGLWSLTLDFSSHFQLDFNMTHSASILALFIFIASSTNYTKYLDYSLRNVSLATLIPQTSRNMMKHSSLRFPLCISFR